MKIISKKEFNRFYKIMKNNPDKSVMELHRLYQKDLMMEANNLMDLEALHAKTLGFIHPKTGKFMQFDSEIPKDFQSCIEKWENYVAN